MSDDIANSGSCGGEVSRENIRPTGRLPIEEDIDILEPPRRTVTEEVYPLTIIVCLGCNLYFEDADEEWVHCPHCSAELEEVNRA